MSFVARRAPQAGGVTLTVVALALAGAAPASAAVPRDQSPPVYPSQQQVDAAKAQAAATARSVHALEAAYAAAGDQLVAVQREVSGAAADYRAAEDALADRTDEAQAAAARSRSAQAALARADETVAQSAQALADQGGSMQQLAALVTSQTPEQLFDVSSALDALASHSASVQDDATRARAVADLDRAEAERAEAQVRAAERQAAAVLAVAQRKVADAQAKATAIAKQQDAMAAQLATLQRTSAALEKQRLDGIAAAKAAAARAAAARAAAARAAAQRAAERAAARRAAAATSEASRSGGSGSGVSGSGVSGRHRASTADAATLAGSARSGGSPRAIARSMLGSYGFGSGQWQCLNNLWMGESGWDWSATNPSSGAYGIPQSLPASKMAAAGGDWLTNPTTQIRWGLGYIQSSYGSPCAAWAAWQSRSPHWY